MRHTAYSGPLFFALILSAFTPSPVARAQATPVAGTSVSVKMVEAVDSGTDPAGKQYRGSVTKAVDAGNGVTIPQGAIVAVTLTRGGIGWTTQLASVTINGVVVPVSSGSASVTSSAQAAASSTMNALNSVLGHRVNTPLAVTAVATGQRVVLPPGITLTFVLKQPPASSASSAAQTVATAAPAPHPASSPANTSVASASGPLTAMEICFSNSPPNPSDLNYRTEFLTAAFETPVTNISNVPVIEPAFSTFLKTAYNYPQAGITCQPIWTINDARQAQKKIIGDRDRAKLKMINTGWRYGRPPVTQGQPSFDPLALGPGGLDLTQHRLTTYFCTLDVSGGTTIVQPQPYNALVATRYISQLFQADWDSAPVSMAYNVYIRDHYVHDLNLSDLSPRCSAQSPAMQTMQHQTALIGSKLIRHIVPVDFTDTTAEAAGGNAAITQAATAAANTPSPAFFMSCSSGGGAGIDTYFTGVFQIKSAKMTPRGYLASPEAQIALDHFYAYLTQKGYKFNHGSDSACDIARTEVAAQAAEHKRAYEGGGCSSCGKVVETGWKDQ